MVLRANVGIRGIACVESIVCVEDGLKCRGHGGEHEDQERVVSILETTETAFVGGAEARVSSELTAGASGFGLGGRAGGSEHHGAVVFVGGTGSAKHGHMALWRGADQPVAVVRRALVRD